MHSACIGKENDVNDFSVAYMKDHWFLPADRKDILFSQLPLHFLVCEGLTQANLDWQIEGQKSSIIHSLSENKRVTSKAMPEVQLTAEVIAANQPNQTKHGMFSLCNTGRTTDYISCNCHEYSISLLSYS
jgi:hypothetical protein